VIWYPGSDGFNDGEKKNLSLGKSGLKRRWVRKKYEPENPQRFPQVKGSLQNDAVPAKRGGHKRDRDRPKRGREISDKLGGGSLREY